MRRMNMYVFKRKALRGEKRKLRRVVKVVSKAMKERLYQEVEDKHGWDDLYFRSYMKEKLLELVESKVFSTENMIDIMNYAMFIWYLGKRDGKE